jgi:hypothetical protein
MEQNKEHNKDTEDKLASFYNSNKTKIFSVLIFFIIITSLFTVLKFNKKNKNNLVAEKFIQAGILLASDQKNKSIEIYEEIINQKNDFYSILALNKIIENNLVTNKKKILNYFEIVNKINKNKDQIDILNFKKALFLIKAGYKKEGEVILKSLITNNSQLKLLAEEIILK